MWVCTISTASKGATRSGTAGSDPDAESDPTQDAQLETVNRLQGGKRDMMVVNATVSDPNYISVEEDFLLTENRITVSLTRHQDLLVVVAPDTLLGHLPQDPDLYDQACLWKTLAIELGEAPTTPGISPDWQDTLEHILSATGIDNFPPTVCSELQSTVALAKYIVDGEPSCDSGLPSLR